MAVYKIFPEKDATVYSAYPNTNTGLDQILEIQNTTSSLNDNAQVSRILLQFPLSTIQDVITNYVGSPSGYEAYLRLFVANATSLPDNYTLYINPISQSWESGTGRFLYNPADENGVTWAQRNNSNKWPSASFAVSTTSSFLAGNPGGAAWYTLFQNYAPFAINDNKDVDVEVTDIVGNFNNLNIPNNGFLIRMQPSYEFNNSASFALKYFSKDTHTIYPPQLEIRWDDSVYNTGSLTELVNDNTVITLGNNIGQYNTNTIYKFRVNARETYPARQFTTVSVYTLNNALPSSSYYAVQDLDTGEYVVNFSEQFTKVSCDPNGNYFDLYMAGFEPERFYKILIKSSFADGSVVVYDNNYTFKINK
jgi:hypothetical protein